jgi:hypothetical protein
MSLPNLTPFKTVSYPAFNETLDVLNQILTELRKNSAAGMQTAIFEALTVNTAPSTLYAVPKPVRSGTLINLSATDTITLTSFGAGSAGKVVNIAAGAGYVLNPASAAGQGGGTFNFGNIDLSTLTAVSSTNNTQKVLVVYYL